MEKFTFFWNGPFSQWYLSPFIVDEKEFNCAEQFMMYQKAKFFGDDEIAEQIMQISSPKEQKALGRKVQGFNKEEWDGVARGFVYVGNMAKFNQNSELRKKLKSTDGTTLVEASPYDKIWGIGLREDDPRAQKRETWLGTNWLGEVLTSVREDIFHNEIL